LKYFIFFLYLACCILLIGCGGSSSSKTDFDIPELPDNTPIGELSDSDDSPNQVSDQLLENNITVGLTVVAEDPDDNVTYQMLDAAEGRFSIDAVTGVVTVADYLLLNGHLFPEHSINVQATSEDGSRKSKVFKIEVIHENVPIGAISDVNELPNEFTEDVKGGAEVGITAQAVDPDDDVSYQLVVDSSGQFQVDKASGVVFLADDRNFTPNSTYEIEVEAISEDGSSSNKKFDVEVLPNYENNIPITSQFKTLFNWDDGEDKYFPGWEWVNNIISGNSGWILEPEGAHGGRVKYLWGYGARSFNKGRDGRHNTAIIDSLVYSPSSSNASSLKVKETDLSETHLSSWWLWYDGMPLSERGITDDTTDRMSFYIKLDGSNPLNDDGGKESIRNNFHIGTYLCWQGEGTAYGTGDGCPYEGPGNQHYYHYLALNPGAWIHVLLDQHPQHLRGNKTTLSNNPTYEKYNKNYFAQLSRFYMEIRYPQEKRTFYNVDEVNFFSTKQMVEQEQNDESITSLWVGYWPEKDVWEMGFQDESYEVYNDSMNSTYEIRWSVKPITNENFNEANSITPFFYGGADFAGQDTEHLIRRPNGWSARAWTRFSLPDEVENNYLKVFFAIRDVSEEGKHIGEKWPYNKGDGHDAPTSNIKIIDYYLRQPAH